MPTQSEELWTPIERFAPGEPLARASRATLYRALRKLPKPREKKFQDAHSFVLKAIVLVHTWHAATRERSGARSRYWKQRETVEKLLAEIDDNPVVRPISPKAVQFYEPDEVVCPHGIHRKRCEEIQRKLAAAEGLLALPVEGPFTTRGRRLQREAESLMRRANVKPRGQSASDFCQYTEPKRPPVLPPQKQRPGRPSNKINDDLLDLVVPCLRSCDLSIEKACEHVETILSCCFGVTVDAGSLARHRRRRRPVRKADKTGSR